MNPCQVSHISYRTDLEQLDQCLHASNNVLQCTECILKYFICMQGVVARWLQPAYLDREVSGTGLGCRGVALSPWARSLRLRMT